MIEVHGYLWGSEGLLGSIYGKTTLRARIGKQVEEIIYENKEIEEATKSNIGDLIKAEMEDSKSEDE